jgi:hypothetical protein
LLCAEVDKGGKKKSFSCLLSFESVALGVQVKAWLVWYLTTSTGSSLAQLWRRCFGIVHVQTAQKMQGVFPVRCHRHSNSQ